MSASLLERLAQFQPSEPRRHQRLAMIPLLGEEPPRASYIALEDALSQGLVHVEEVSAAGSVPELRVLSNANEPVLVLDGEELIGAKQNRVLNITVLLKPQSVTILPVSCVERGRWSARTKEFVSSKFHMPADMRRDMSRSVGESTRERKNFQSDQSEVWAGVEKMGLVLETLSPTSSMNDIFAAREEEVDASAKALPVVENQRGMIVLLDGKVIGMDYVSRAGVWARLHDRLLRSYAVGSLRDTAGKKRAPSAASLVAKAAAFLRSLPACTATTSPSVGLGEDWRFQGGQILGSALVLDGEIIHAAFFPEEPGGGDSPPRISPLDRRRASRHENIE